MKRGMFFRAAVAGSLAYLTISLARFMDSQPVPPPPVVIMAPPPVDGDTTRVVDVRRADLERTVALAASARIVPAFRDGAPIGVKLYAIRPDSALALLGLQNGDTLIALNDVPASSPDVALEVQGPLRQPDHLDLDIERRGARMRILVLLH
jgi:type II secretory pathway component PulC